MRTACRAAPGLHGLCRWIRQACIRSHALSTLQLTDHLPPSRLWSRAAWKTQTFLLSFELRFPGRLRGRVFHRNEERERRGGMKGAITVLCRNEERSRPRLTLGRAG